jgi:hypothetical protein
MWFLCLLELVLTVLLELGWMLRMLLELLEEMLPALMKSAQCSSCAIFCDAHSPTASLSFLTDPPLSKSGCVRYLTAGSVKTVLGCENIYAYAHSATGRSASAS